MGDKGNDQEDRQVIKKVAPGIVRAPALEKVAALAAHDARAPTDEQLALDDDSIFIAHYKPNNESERLFI